MPASNVIDIWRQAIELAAQRTREAEGPAGDATQLQRGPSDASGSDCTSRYLMRAVCYA